jgi:hypothetical protein
VWEEGEGKGQLQDFALRSLKKIPFPSPSLALLRNAIHFLSPIFKNLYKKQDIF